MQYNHEFSFLELVFMFLGSAAACVAFWAFTILVFALEPSQPLFR